MNRKEYEKTADYQKSVELVKEFVDDAIAHADKKSKGLFARLSKKRIDEDGNKLLLEEGFGKSHGERTYTISDFELSATNEKLSKIRDKSNKFSNLGQKLGFSFGLVVFILIL